MTKLQKISDDEYDIIDKGEENFHHIILKGDSPYAGVIYQYGMVQLLEEDEQLRVKFEYEVFENPRFLDTRSDKFVDYVGHILMTNLEELLVFNKYQKASSKSGD
jgi:hypothetical protein